MSSVLLIYLKYILLCPSVVLLRYGSKNAVRAAISQRSQKRLTKDKKRLGSLHLAYIISKIYIKSKDFIHPRCGENGISGRETELTQGSPPRMRGKPKEYTDKQDVAGITPADAGKTSVKGSNRNNYWDHPRGCGEIFSVIPCPNYGKGSPPRMRGPPVCGIGR